MSARETLDDEACEQRLRQLSHRYERLLQGLTQARAQFASLREITPAVDQRLDTARERVTLFHQRLKELQKQIDVLE